MKSFLRKNWIALTALLVVLAFVAAPAFAGVVKRFRGQVAFPESGLVVGGNTLPTSAEIIAAADVSTRLVDIGDADYTVLAANSGKPHVVANVSADRTFTLPSASSGLEFDLYSDMVAADGHDWIIDTGADANYFTGGLLFADTDVGGAASEVIIAAGDGDSNSILQINLPAPGTHIKLISDGTLWTLSGVVVSTTAPAFSDQP